MGLTHPLIPKHKVLDDSVVQTQTISNLLNSILSLNFFVFGVRKNERFVFDNKSRRKI